VYGLQTENAAKLHKGCRAIVRCSCACFVALNDTESIITKSKRKWNVEGVVTNSFTVMLYISCGKPEEDHSPSGVAEGRNSGLRRKSKRA
jgi:hypothetical protein